MADESGIEWTDATWNPVTGCTQLSPGCDHCYAMMLDATMDLFNTQDVQRGFLNTAKAFDANVQPPEMTFEGK